MILLNHLFLGILKDVMVRGQSLNYFARNKNSLQEPKQYYLRNSVILRRFLCEFKPSVKILNEKFLSHKIE